MHGARGPESASPGTSMKRGDAAYGGCRVTSRPALSSRTLGTYHQQSDRPSRTSDHVPGGKWGLTPSARESRDSLYDANLRLGIDPGLLRKFAWPGNHARPVASLPRGH